MGRKFLVFFLVAINVSIFWLTLHEFRELSDQFSFALLLWLLEMGRVMEHWVHHTMILVSSVPSKVQNYSEDTSCSGRIHYLPTHPRMPWCQETGYTGAFPLVAGTCWLFVWDFCPSDIPACHVIEVTWGVIEGKLWSWWQKPSLGDLCLCQIKCE